MPRQNAKSTQGALQELLKGCKGSQIKISQVKEWLLENLQDNMNRETRVTLNIWSTPGVGKTSLVKELAKIPVEWNGKKWAGYEIVDIPLAQIEEMGDVLGFPVEEIKMKKGKEEKWIKAVNSLIQDYLGKGWTTEGEQRTIYAPPSWVPKEERPGVLLFDDGNRASQRIMKGLMQLVQDYKTISWKIPNGWTIVFTGNPDNRSNQVTAMDMAQLTRMKHVTLLPDVTEWAKWVYSTPDVDVRIADWAKQNPELFIPPNGERTNPRSLAEFGRALKRFSDLKKKGAYEKCRIEGNASLDEAVVDSILIYLSQYVGTPILPMDILTNYAGVKGKLEELMVCKEPRLDIVNVTCDRLLDYLEGDEYRFDKSHAPNLVSWLLDPNMPKDRATAFVMHLRAKKRPLAEQLFADQRILELVKTHSGLK